MRGVASSPAQIKREARGSLRLWRPGLLAALGGSHRLPAFNPQPAHRPEAGQAGKRNTITGGFLPATTSRLARQVCLLPCSFFSAGLFPR